MFKFSRQKNKANDGKENKETREHKWNGTSEKTGGNKKKSLTIVQDQKKQKKRKKTKTFEKKTQVKLNKMKKMRAIGSRRQVFFGYADHTKGGLKRDDLVQNRWGRIVSKKKHATAKRENRLRKYGYGARKGKFGAVRLSRSSKSKRRAKRGGAPHDLSNAAPLTNFGSEGSIGVQTAAGMSGGRRRRSRRHRRGGGISAGPHDLSNAANVDGEGAKFTDYTQYGSIGPQLAAGMAGGRRRKSRRHRRRHRGGTTTRNPQGYGLGVAQKSPLNAALNAA